jgi:hypothetical protein
MTLELPKRPDDSLVFSVMYTRWKGPLLRYCDLMVDGGQILARLPEQELGLKPSESAIEQSVSEVIEFVATCKDQILRTLPDVS